MRNGILVVACSVFLATNSCVALSPELVSALSKDDASFCVAADVRGGAGGIIGGATGGYGQSTLILCRSQMPDAKISISPDGSISIEHGKVE